MQKNLTSIQDRAYQYWFVDGLAEMAAGLISLFLSVFFTFQKTLLTGQWSLLVWLGAGLVLSFGLRLLIQRIKARTTYPRTGYAAPSTGLEKKWSLLAVVAFTLLLLGANAYLTIRGPQALLWSPAIGGVVFGFVLAWTGAFTKLRRFYLPAAASFVAGVAASFLGMELFQAIAVIAGLTGAILLIQGYRVHRSYLRQNPAPASPEHE